MKRSGHISALLILGLVSGLAYALGFSGTLEDGYSPASHTMSGGGWEVRAVAGGPNVSTSIGGDWTIHGGVIGPAMEDCLGDWDGSGSVDITDLLTFLGAYGTAEADLNGDGVGDINDLLILLGAFGGCG